MKHDSPSQRSVQSVLRASSTHIFAETLAKLVQSFAILGLAGLMTKDEYASFVLIYALHLLCTAIISGGVTETIASARERLASNDAYVSTRPPSSFVLMAPSMRAASILAIFSVVFVVGIAGFLDLSIALVVSPAAILGSLSSAVFIGLLRTGTTVTQAAGMNISAASYRATQTIAAFATALICISAVEHDRLTAFYVGLSIASGLVLLVFYSRLPNVRAQLSDAQSTYASTWQLLRDATNFMPVSLFGWIFGYGYAWLIRVAEHDLSKVADFSLALSITFFCPLILSSVYGVVASIEENDRQTDDIDHRRRYRSKDDIIWSNTILMMSMVGALLVAIWPFVNPLFGGQFSKYSHLSTEIAHILLGYCAISLHYTAALAYIKNNARRTFLLVGLSSNMIAICLAFALVTMTSVPISLTYTLALVVRGVPIGMVAWLRWRTPPHIMSIFAGCLVVYLCSITSNLNLPAISGIVITALCLAMAFVTVRNLRPNTP